MGGSSMESWFCVIKLAVGSWGAATCSSSKGNDAVFLKNTDAFITFMNFIFKKISFYFKKRHSSSLVNLSATRAIGWDPQQSLAIFLTAGCDF